MAEPNELVETAPELPPPVEIPEYYTGFAQEFGQMSVELQDTYKRMQKAEKNLPTPAYPEVTGWFGRFLDILRWPDLLTKAQEGPGLLAELRGQAMADFDAAVIAFQVAEWKVEVMQDLPILLSDTEYVVESAADILKYLGPGPDVELSDADTVWLNDLYGNMQHLSNILPEDYQGDILDVQSKILNEILTEPKLELKGVHRLTVDEIAKAFAFGVAELPEGMTEEDVRNLLSQFDLSDEELQNQHDWLKERIREWEIEAARMSMIRAGAILAETPELTPLQWAKLTVTQPMMATVEAMQKWWDAISRPISAAIMMHLPAELAGIAHGAPLGFVVGGIAGGIVGAAGGPAAPITMPVGAIIGAIAGAIGGAAWFSTWEDEASKELTKHYEFYRNEGESAWSSYAKAFNEWDAPWWKKAILDSAYDPMFWIGWGGATAVGRKLATAALPRGLKWAGSRIGNLLVAFEQGYCAGADAVFRGAMHVVAAPIKSTFWLTGAGYTIPKTFTQMSRNFARKGLMDFKAVLDRTFPHVRNLRGLAAKDVHDTTEAVIRMALNSPMEGNNLAVRAGTNLLEFNYLDDVVAAKFVKEVAGDVVFDTSRLARFNSNILDAFSGQGDRITAGKVLGDLGVEATENSVKTLAAKIGKFKETIARKAIDAVKGDTADDMLLAIFNRLESTRYGNLHSPLTKHMQQAGRAASWHSRVADRILYSTHLVRLERWAVMPIARWQLLFTNFGPYNFAENMGRSFLGGGEMMYPKAYSGVAETNRLMKGLSNAPYELQLFERGQVRLTQAIVDPKTGTTAVFKRGNIPFITRNVRIPEKIPRFGGKMLGKTLTIGDQRYFIGSAQDWYDMWAKLTADQTAFDVQTHFLKALDGIAPDDMRAISDVIEVKTKSMLDDIASITKKDAFDIRRELRLEAVGGGPDSIRGLADIDVITFQRRMISKEINKIMDNFTDVHSVTKVGVRDEILDGRMFTKGADSIDDRMAAWVASERELNIASLANQMDALKTEADAFIANPPRNLDDFLGDMQSISAHVEGVGERIHDFRRITELRKAKLLPADFDNFEVGSAKMLAEFMETSEESLTKVMNQLTKNAKMVGLDEVQLARLADLDSISRLELENILATRTKIADIEAIIPRTPKRLRNDRFWSQQRSQKSIIWDEYDALSRRLKSLRLASSRNFLTSVDKYVYVPDFVPDVVGELTPNHLAYLYGCTGDDLYRGLTRIQHHITVRPREDFIVHTKDYANAYAAKFGKTADQLGFTDEAIGEVYDQMWRNLGIDPSILTPDHPTILQMEELRQEIHRLHASTKIPESDVIKWRQYLNSVADGVGDTSAYKAAVAAPEIIYSGGADKIKDVIDTVLKDLPSDIRNTITEIRLVKGGLPGVGRVYGNLSDEGIMKLNVAMPKLEFEENLATTIYHEAMHKYSIDKILAGDASLVNNFGRIFNAELIDPAKYKGMKASVARLALYKEHRNTLETLAGSFEDYIAGKKAGLPKEVVDFFDNWIGKMPKVAPAVVSGTPDWWAKKESAAIKAREMHALAYPTYDDANILDETMRAIFPFWNYELFRWKWIPRTFMRTPGTMSALARYMEYTDQGYMPVPGTDLQLNILRGTVWMGGLRSFYLKDFPEYHDVAPGVEFLDYIGRAGFFPGVHVMLPVVLFGAAGKAPQFGQLAPAWIKTGLSALRTLSPQHIGAVLEIVYPDRFRDYMAMMQLGSMGYDADEIWKKKQQGEKLTSEEEKLWLQAVNNVDGVKGILMNQTGLFRIRPAEFTQIRQSMRLAVEEATGVPTRTQEWIDKMYPVTGKRFSDYFHLDIQQQALLYQWESFRRYQGITEPLYPSSWQALDIKRSDYYAELERVYNDARYNGIYENGNLIQQSMLEINRQLVEGIIGPSQWISMRSDMQGGLSEAVRVLGESPAYKDVPKTFEEMAALLEERSIVIPAQTPDQELLYYYYELKPELKYNWESDRMELDFDTYYAYIDILLETLGPTHRERLLQRIQNDWTPMELLYWQFSRDFARPYRNIRSVVLNEYTDEQVKTIRRFEVARGAERAGLLEVMGPDGKLIAGYQKRLREARQRLRILDPTLDAWLYFFGTTDKFMSHESEDVYNQLKEQYLTPAMVGEAK